MKHVLSVLVKNRTGVLVRVASMFSRREFNIDSLAVGITESPEFSRITLVVHGDEYLVDQMMKQLEKLKGCEAHSSVILSNVDQNVFQKLGMNVTNQPVYKTKKLYHG